MAKLYFFFAAMNAGKSTHLLQAAHNYEFNGGSVLVFTSAFDDRYGVGRVSSRLGISVDAVALRKSDNLFDMVHAAVAETPISAVMIDEVQFLFPEHIRQAARIVDELNVPVMAYGLKNNVFGELFSDSIAVILAFADEIREIKTVCFCGKKANMILRYAPDGSVEKSGKVIEIGSESRYTSVCRRHWMAGDIGDAARARLQVAETAA